MIVCWFVFCFSSSSHTHTSTHSLTYPTQPPNNQPNRYQLATGGSENVAKVWDVRKKQNAYTLPAHSGLISSIKCVRGLGYICVYVSVYVCI
jgi:WD40 repeat protein